MDGTQLFKTFLLPPATKFGQGYVFTGVCDSVHSGGSASVHTGMPHPLGADTPWSRDPPEQTPPGADTPWSRHPPEQTPPWEQTSLGVDPQGVDTPPQSRHTPQSRPPREQSMLRDTVNARAVRILLECNLVKLLIYYLKRIKMLEFGDQNSGFRIHNGFQDQFLKCETSCLKRKYSISSVCGHFTI